jgi:hypothetical protein
VGWRTAAGSRRVRREEEEAAGAGDADWERIDGDKFGGG